MSIHFNKQSQFELFPGATNRPEENTSTRFFLSKLTLSLESLVVVGIVIIVLIVVSFCLGVERGKRVVRAEKKEIKAEVEDVVAGSLGVSLPVMPSQKKGVAAPQPAEAVGGPLGGVPEDKKPIEMGSQEKVVDKGYTVQVASYQKEDYAQKAAEDLKAKEGKETTVMLKGKYWIVCLGKFSGKKDADAYANKLRKKFKDCKVRSL
jgi:hypothetical protein